MTLTKYQSDLLTIPIGQGWTSLHELADQEVADARRSDESIANFLEGDRPVLPVEKRVANIRDNIFGSMSSNGFRGVIVDRRIDEIVASGVGDQPELTHVLMAALDAPGIDSRPVWVCAHDLVEPINAPLPQQFTDLVLVTDEPKPRYYHMVRDWPADRLPPHLEDAAAFVADGEARSLDRTASTRAGAHVVDFRTDLALSSDGGLSGTLEMVHLGHPAIMLERLVDDQEAISDYIAAMADSDQDRLRITDGNVVRDDKVGAIIVSAKIEIEGGPALQGDPAVLELPFFSTPAIGLEHDDSRR